MNARELLPEKKISHVLEEASELTAIMAASYISESQTRRDGSANSKLTIRNQQSAI
jgi:hypothetical protein